jgi:hypothetical protein
VWCLSVVVQRGRVGRGHWRSRAPALRAPCATRRRLPHAPVKGVDGGAQLVRHDLGEYRAVAARARPRAREPRHKHDGAIRGGHARPRARRQALEQQPGQPPEHTACGHTRHPSTQHAATAACAGATCP